MDDVLSSRLRSGMFSADDTAERTDPPTPKPTWVMMGDVTTFRAGVPEHLIQWRRAKGERDPEPR